MASRRRRSFADQYREGDAAQAAPNDVPAVADRTDQELDAILEPYLARDRRTIKDVPVEQLESSPFQARQFFDPQSHAELVVSIKQRGFFGVISVRPHPTAAQRYQIVYGERRWRAAKDAGLQSIPAQIGHYDDIAMMDIGLMENIHRADPHPLDMAHGLRRRMQVDDLSIRQVSDHLGVSKSFVENHLALLQLPPDVQDMVRQRSDTLRAAREIGKLPTAELRAPLIAGVVAGEFGKAEVTRRVQALLAPPPPPVPQPDTHRAAPAYTSDNDQHTMPDAVSDDLRWLVDEEPVAGVVARPHPPSSVEHTQDMRPVPETPSPDTSLLLDWQKECARIERAIVHWRTQLAMHKDEALRQRVRADIEGLQLMLQHMDEMVSST
jgi:ParB family chromosome partitioning protein